MLEKSLIIQIEEEIDDFSTEPERGLLAAVLGYAIHDSQSTNQIKAYDAKHWILWKGSEEFSFLWICQQLDLNPEALKRHILSLPKSSFPFTLGRRTVPNGYKKRYNRSG
jgi:hypothetical protein